MKKILLCSMPFGALERQALGLSLLKASLVKAGIPCDILYLSFTFAELIGGEEYNWIELDLPHTAFAGEWIFLEALYGPNPGADRRYLDEVLRRTWHLDESSIKRIQRDRALATHFLDYCMAAVPWQDYVLVGFTSTFEQNISSLALAKRIKAKYPSIKIVFGGANWEDEMGLELHQKFRFVDYVLPGEADRSFPALAEHLFSKESANRQPRKIRGIIYRQNGRSIYTGQSELVRDLDQLPIPDYSDYFDTLEKSSAASFVVPTLLFESSRGCWWGSKSQCIFCGLNGDTMAYRTKSSQRALEEIKYMIDKWKIDSIQAVDNVLDMTSFKDFLPALVRLDMKLQLFYEVKANLTRAQIKMLRDAGVNRIQPGLESLSNNVLRIMRKGTTALKNIQMLKWSKEYGVLVAWNILYGFPGETKQDYYDILELLKQIRFLDPPNACGPVRLDRFSPLFKTHEEYGLTNIKPIAPYKYLYPFSDESIMKIAYYFDYAYEPDIDPTGLADEVVGYVREWQLRPEKGVLRAIEGSNDKLVLLDTRSDAIRHRTLLAGKDREVYEYCDRYRTVDAVVQHLQAKFPGSSIGKSQVRTFLDALVSNRLMVTDGANYLSLALR